MTRILHVTDCFAPSLGGIEVHVEGLLRHQRAGGDDARVATVTAAAPGVPDPAYVVRCGTPGVAGLPAAQADLAAHLRADPPDVVHLHVSVVSPFTFRAAFQVVALGLPALVTVHSMWEGYGPIPRAITTVLGARRLPVQWSAVSTSAARALREALRADASLPIAVLPNAVDADAWPLVGAAPEVATITSVLRFTTTKRALPMLRMLREVRRRVPAVVPLRAVLVGEGRLLPRAAEQVGRAGLDWVELPGRLEHDRIRELFSASSLYLSPATQESFGIAALEARCSGLPVVARTQSGSGEFVTSGVDGVLGRSDAELVDALVALVSDPDALAAMRERCRAMPDLGWDRAVARNAELYDAAAAVVGRPPVGAAR